MYEMDAVPYIYVGHSYLPWLRNLCIFQVRTNAAFARGALRQVSSHTMACFSGSATQPASRHATSPVPNPLHVEQQTK